MKQVSVCMATYNGALYIEEQIHSILSQLSPNDELIISDDGSTDSTIQLITSINDQRIRIVPSQGYKSSTKNFENALRYAEGRYIFLTDQDDIWYANKLNLVLNKLLNYDLVLTDCEIINEQGDIIHESFFKIRDSQPGFWRNLWKNSYIGCCMAFRRDILIYILPFPKRICFHDWWIGLMVELKGSVCFYSKPLIHYRRHQTNVTPTGESNPSFYWSERFQNRFWLIWYALGRALLNYFSSLR